MLPSSARPRRRQGLSARLVLVNGGLVVGTALVLSALSLYLLSFQISGSLQGRLDATRELAATILDLRVDELAGVAAQMSGDALTVRALQTRDPALAQSLAQRTAGSGLDLWLLLGRVLRALQVNLPLNDGAVDRDPVLFGHRRRLPAGTVVRD